jgi:hypothetical protein
MTEEEQVRQTQLREQLASVHNEARLYRSLFWALLVLAASGTLLHLLSS